MRERENFTENIKLQKAMIVITLIIIMCLGFMLCGCNENTLEPVNTAGQESTPENTTPQQYQATESGLVPENMAHQQIELDASWNYELTDQMPNEEAAMYWERFLSQKENDATTSELIASLCYVTSRDAEFIPGLIEQARYYILDYNETGDTTSPADALNTLTYGYTHTGNPLFLELKNSLDFPAIEEIILRAEEALKENNNSLAYKIIHELPEHYFYIAEASRILTLLEKMDDTYYYLVLGPAAGNQYIVHFKLDGTYERVKLNQDGIYDSGEYKYEIMKPWNLSFAGLQLVDRNTDYYWVEYESHQKTKEYIMTEDTEGRAKAQFEEIANAGENVKYTG